MKKEIFGILFVAAAVVFGYKILDVYRVKISLLLLDNEIAKTENQQVLATFDPKNELPEALQHYRLKINAESDWQLEKNELIEDPSETPVLLTVEIWGYGVLKAISEGNYDQKISKLLEPLAPGKDIFIRFNPEMEIPNSSNTWSNWGQIYVAAFQHFSALIKIILPAAKVVWGPAGAMGNMEYYPGKEYFEVASLSLEKEDETDLFLRDKDNDEQVNRKLHRMRFVDVPLIILGPKHLSTENNSAMLEAGFKNFKEAKKLTFLEDLTDEKILRETLPLVGVYDPEKKLVHAPAVTIEHLFIGFERIATGSFEKDFEEVLSRGNDVIITLEPQNYPETSNQSNVLKQILSGKFDPLLERFFEVTSKTEKKIYFRFAHEMEIPVERYPWQM